MVMKPEPLAGALAQAKGLMPAATTLLLSPQGRRFDQQLAESLAQAGELFGDEALTSALAELETFLYGGRSGNWDGAALRAAVERLQREFPGSREAGGGDSGFALYPGD